MHLPENLREKLKIPLGVLILDSQTSKENILKHISDNSFVITVGDATTEKMQNHGIIPSLQIIDSHEKRNRRDPPNISQVSTTLFCRNPAGQITEQSIQTIKQAVTSKPPVRIIVDGEEDLLVVPVCIAAPENAIIMYGQPNEGLVVVTINEAIKEKTKSILDAMD